MLNRIQSPDDASTRQGMSCSTGAIKGSSSRNEDEMNSEGWLLVGIDIAAKTFTAAWGHTSMEIGSAQTFEQNPVAYRGLISELRATGCPATHVQVVMEATGSYWTQVARSLYEAGFQVHVINPKQAYHYAQSKLQLTKTDAIDARLLAEMAASLTTTTPWQPPSTIQEALYQRLVERDNLLEIRQMLRNQLHALHQRPHTDAAVEDRKQALIDELNRQISLIDQELEDWLNTGEWQAQAMYLRSIKGIGLISAAWLLVITNGFSTCERAEQLAAYLGVVPHRRESGSSRKGYKPTGHSGHARARRVLYQATISAVRYNPLLKAFYDRLITRGKHVKVARIAATRKLIHIAFAIVTKEQIFDPHYQTSHGQPVLTT
jgi:transposase